MDRENMYWISATILAVLVVGTGGYYLEYYEITGIRDLCVDGEIWIQQDDSALYYCPSEDSYRYCDHLSESKRSCYVMEFIGIGTRTPSTETICSDGKCNLILYSGTRFVEEDNIWKKIEEARSLKDVWDVVYLEDDGDHRIDVLDYNYTSINLNLSFIGNAEEYEYEVEGGKIKIKFKIIETKFNETSLEPYEEEIEYEVEIEEDEKESFVYPNPLGKKFQFGESSTTIKLQDADTENLDDTQVIGHSNFDDYAVGSSDSMNIQCGVGNDRRIYIKFNFSAIPSWQQIDESKLFLYLYDAGFDYYDIVVAHHFYNHSWLEGVWGVASWNNLTWLNQPCGVGFDDSTQCNLTVEGSVGINNSGNVAENKWWNWTVTNMVSKEYSDGDKNVSIVLKPDTEGCVSDNVAQFRSKEYATTSLRPYLNITYSEAPAPEVTLDSPINNTISKILNQYFNASYTATAGDLVNATLNIWNSTSLVYNLTESVTGSSNSSSINFTFTNDDEYLWNYHVCDDSILCDWADDNFTLTIDTTPPTFTNLINLSADANSSFSYDIDATDSSGISCFTVNDTTNFQINCSGYLINNTVLSVQVYSLNITVNDSANNLAYDIINVNVTVWDTILKWDWAALMTDSVSPDQICFIFREGEGCIDDSTFFLPAYVFSHTNNTIPVASAGVWYNVTFDEEETEPKKRITHTHDDNTNDTFTIVDDGFYNLHYAMSFSSAQASPTSHVVMRVIKNGVEILGSLLEEDATKQYADFTISNGPIVYLVTGDELKFQFTSDDTDVSLTSHRTYGDHHDTAIVKIIRIA